MRVSTSYIFDQNLTAMLNQQSELGKTQLQVSTGKRILSPSDDPAGSVQILNLQREFSLTEQYMSNSDKAANKQVIEEGALESATELLQRIREKAVQALNATNTQGDRRAIAAEISQLNEQLLSLANTRDSAGDYLFAGFNSNTQPYETIHGDYQGDEGQRNLKIGSDVLVETNDAGNHVFESPLVSTTVTSTFAPVFTTGTANAGTGTAVVTSHTPGFPEVSLTFFDTPDRYEVTDGTTTATAAYTSGMTLDLFALDPNFSPMTLDLTGAPVAGDVLTITEAVPATLDPVVTARIPNTGTGAVALTGYTGGESTFAEVNFTFSAGPPTDEYVISDGVTTETITYTDPMNVDLVALNPNFPPMTLDLSGTPTDSDAFSISNGTGSGQLTVIEDSSAAEVFTPVTFTFHELIPATPPAVDTPARYEISDGTNTSSVDYVAGMRVDLGDLNPNFPSITVELSGTPAEGNVLEIERTVTSNSQSMFKTIDNFVQALNSNAVGVNDSPNNGDFLTNITASLDTVVDTRAKVGARLNAIDQQRQINDGLSLTMQTTLSEIQDLDYAEAISRLTRQTTALQAAQQSFVKVQGLSLFNYL